jgi:hypothetical protein
MMGTLLVVGLVGFGAWYGIDRLMIAYRGWKIDMEYERHEIKAELREKVEDFSHFCSCISEGLDYDYPTVKRNLIIRYLIDRSEIEVFIKQNKCSNEYVACMFNELCEIMDKTIELLEKQGLVD